MFERANGRAHEETDVPPRSEHPRLDEPSEMEACHFFPLLRRTRSIIERTADETPEAAGERQSFAKAKSPRDCPF
jgi:hypothetical protein